MARKTVQRIVEDDRPGEIWEPVEDYGELDAEVREHLQRGRAVALTPDRVTVRSQGAAGVVVLLLPVLVLVLGLALGSRLLALVAAALLLLPCLAGGGVLVMTAFRHRSEVSGAVPVRPIDLAAPEEALRRRAAEALQRVIGREPGLEEHLAETLPAVLRASDDLAPRLVRSSRLRLAVDALTPSTARDALVEDLTAALQQSADVVDALTSYADHVAELTSEVRALRDQERALELRGQLDELTASGAAEEQAATWLRHDTEGLAATASVLAEVRERLYDDVRRLTR